MRYVTTEENIKFDVGPLQSGQWSWRVYVHTGMVDDADVGPRMIRKGEEPPEGALIWYVMAHGHSRNEREAYAAAADALMNISQTVAKLYGAATLGEARASSNARGEL